MHQKIKYLSSAVFNLRIVLFQRTFPTPLEIQALLHTFLYKFWLLQPAPPLKFPMTLLGMAVDIFCLYILPKLHLMDLALKNVNAQFLTWLPVTYLFAIISSKPMC